MRLVAANWDVGRPVHGYAWLAERPQAVVLLQHGYAEHAGRYVDHYSRLIPCLVGLGMSIYAFDLRGHGLSPGRRAVTDVEQAVDDHLHARRLLSLQGKPVFLIGHSLGGLVTAASVIRDDANVAGVILSSPALLVKSDPGTRVAARLMSAIVPRLGLLAPQPPEGLSRIAAEVAAFERDPLVYHGKMPTRLAATALAVGRAAWGHYPHWVAPTLVMHGTSDPFTDINGSRLFASTIRSRDKLLLVVPEGRHELLNDKGREGVLQSITEWLSVRLGSMTNNGKT